MPKGLYDEDFLMIIGFDTADLQEPTEENLKERKIEYAFKVINKKKTLRFHLNSLINNTTFDRIIIINLYNHKPKGKEEEKKIVEKTLGEIRDLKKTIEEKKFLGKKENNINIKFIKGQNNILLGEKNMPNQPKKDKSKTVKIEEDSKTDRFIRVVGKRANFVIDKLLIMGKVLQNPQNYEYTLEQVDKIFEPIEVLTAKLRERFIESISQEEKKALYKVEL